MRAVDHLASGVRRLPDLRGRAPLAWRLKRLQHQATLRGAWDITLVDGTRLTLPRSSEMTWSVAFTGHYDRPLQRLLLGYIRPGTTVLDVGASLGLWTVPLAKVAREVGARVWAFEPHPQNHQWLERNVALNGLEDTVTIHRCALGDAVGEARMGIGETQDFQQGGNAAINVDSESALGVLVPIKRLDDFAIPASVSAMKIDVEGYEISVLRGAKELIARDRPVILGEFDRNWIEQRGESLRGFLEDVGRDGYQPHVLEKRSSRPWLVPRQVVPVPLASGREPRPGDDMLLLPTKRLHTSAQATAR
jgi:FkbM family methyltransferase